MRPDLLVIAPSIQRDKGEALVALKQIEALLKSGYRVTCITARCDLDHPNLRVVRILLPASPGALMVPLSVALNTLAAFVVRKRLRAPVLVHMHGARALARCDILSVHFSVRTYMRRVGVSRARSAGLVFRFNSWIADHCRMAVERWLFKPGRVRVFAPVSTGLGNELCAEFAVESGSVRPVVNGVDTSRFYPDAQDRKCVRNELGITDTSLLAVFTGGDWSRKGLDLAVRSLERSEAWSLLVLGKGDRQWLDAIVAGSGIDPDRVMMVGHVTNPERYLRAADAFLFPTAYETFSLAAYEAAATELPIIATKVSGIEELLMGRDPAGFVIDRKVTAIAEALDALMSRELRESLGKQARSIAKQYSWQSSAQSYLKLIDDIPPA